LSDAGNSETQNFSISIPRGSYIADAITRFVSGLDTGKGINVNIQETNSGQVINNIIDGPFNIGIIRYQTDYENYFLDYLNEKQLRYEPVWEFEYLVVMSENHPLKSKEKLDYQELRTYTEITHGDTFIPYLMPNGSRAEEAVKTTNCIYVNERCSQFDLLAAVPTTYMWVSPIPDKWLNRYKLVQRKCKAYGHKFKDVLIFPKDYKLTELDRRFIDKLSEVKNEVSFREYR
jgi:DNA-binding transcriptional LysR family regulator